jgi:hypothetical protein
LGHNLEIYEILKKDYFRVPTEESYYDLGLLTADGSISQNKQLILKIKREDEELVIGFRDRIGRRNSL